MNLGHNKLENDEKLAKNFREKFYSHFLSIVYIVFRNRTVIEPLSFRTARSNTINVQLQYAKL